MSKTQTPGPPPSKEALQQQHFNQLSQQFKNPLRTILSESDESVLSTMNVLIQNVVQLTSMNQDLSGEVTRLIKLCEENKVDTSVKIVKPAEIPRVELTPPTGEVKPIPKIK